MTTLIQSPRYEVVLEPTNSGVLRYFVYLNGVKQTGPYTSTASARKSITRLKRPAGDRHR